MGHDFHFENCIALGVQILGFPSRVARMMAEGGGIRTPMLVTLGFSLRIPDHTGILAGGSKFLFTHRQAAAALLRLVLKRMALGLAVASGVAVFAQQGSLPAPMHSGQSLPPRVAAARRFLLHHGTAPHRNTGLRARPQSMAGAATWQPLGPAGVLTANYGLVTGRISSLALDPSDPTGNRLFAGTTGGGVWFSPNAAASDPTGIEFVPLTDNLAGMSTTLDASLSIGALSVQPPGGTGVILAGTGDPNDALDSYYGGGILRSTDGGQNWSLIPGTTGEPYKFAGEGFAGFAWSTDNHQSVVAAVSQAWEGLLVGAQEIQNSY